MVDWSSPSVKIDTTVGMVVPSALCIAVNAAQPSGPLGSNPPLNRNWLGQATPAARERISNRARAAAPPNVMSHDRVESPWPTIPTRRGDVRKPTTTRFPVYFVLRVTKSAAYDFVQEFLFALDLHPDLQPV